MTKMKLVVGGNLEDDARAFVDAWRMAERREISPESVLAFESWEGLARVMTGERLRMLRHLHARPEPSISSLARSLGRPYRRVHGDVVALVTAGLVAREGGGVQALADTIIAELRLAA